MTKRVFKKEDLRHKILEWLDCSKGRYALLLIEVQGE